MEPAQYESAHRAFRRSVELAGGQSAFERLTGAKQQNVSNWLRRRKVLPAEYVRIVERETGIPKEELRPDLFDPTSAIPDRAATADDLAPAR